MHRRSWVLLGLVIALLAGVFAYTTGGMPPREAPEWLTAQKIAHRGQWTDDALRPENSLAAFEEAASNGYAVELDVHLTADGEIVVVHDDDVQRMTGAPGKVSEMTLAELKALRLKGGPERIPTLAEALDLIDGSVPVFVEIKNEGEIGPLEDAVAAQLSAYEGEACVMSFNPFSLRHLAETSPGILRGQLSGALEGEDLAWHERFLLRHLMMNWASKPDFIAYELEHVPNVDTWLQRARGRPLLAWTAEDSADIARVGPHCDGFICDPGAL